MCVLAHWKLSRLCSHRQKRPSIAVSVTVTSVVFCLLPLPHNAYARAYLCVHLVCFFQFCINYIYIYAFSLRFYLRRISRSLALFPKVTIQNQTDFPFVFMRYYATICVSVGASSFLPSTIPTSVPYAAKCCKQQGRLDTNLTAQVQARCIIRLRPCSFSTPKSCLISQSCRMIGVSLVPIEQQF